MGSCRRIGTRPQPFLMGTQALLPQKHVGRKPHPIEGIVSMRPRLLIMLDHASVHNGAKLKKSLGLDK